MCSYCGCLALPEIAALSHQHELIVNAIGDLRRSRTAGDSTEPALTHLAGLLAGHLDREEFGLFTELRHHDDLRAHVDDLCDEHDDIQLMVDTLAIDAAEDLSIITRLETLLRRHIDREDNGLFPAAAIALDGAEWDAIESRVPLD